MNRKEQIKKVSNEINSFINANIDSLDVKKVEDNIDKIAERNGFKVNQLVQKNDEGVISEMLFIVGDCLLVSFIYDTDGKQDEGEGVDATVNSQIIGIDDKDLFLKNLDPGDPTQRLLYLYVAGEDVSKKFS